MSLILRSLLRDWRSGELTLLFLALIIAVSCVSSLTIFSTMVNQQLVQQAAQIAGADLVISSSIPINEAWFIEAEKMELKQTTTLTFLSMVNHEEAIQLAQIKAVASSYPLLGTIKIAATPLATTASITEPPASNTVWLAAPLYSSLQVKTGDQLTIGASSFTIAGVLVEEPGQSGDWFNISPKILMNEEDIEKTQVVQPGSNLTYRWLLTGPASQLNQLKNYLKNKLTEQQEIFDSHANESAMTQIIQRTLNYLNLGTIMSLVLAGVAISMASLRYSQRHMQQVALLRCFGASQRKIISIHLGSVLLLGLLACLLGVIVGYSLQPLLLVWLRGLLPSLNPSFSLWPALLSIATGMIVLLCFSIANILALRHITAASILRKQAIAWDNNIWLSYGAAFLLLGFLAYFYTRSWVLTLMALYACVVFILFVVGTLKFVFSYLVKRRSLPINWRFGFANIARNLNNSALQVIGIGLALTAILSLSLLRYNLLDDWQQQLPANAANYFIINIQPEQVEPIALFLQKNAIENSSLYPVVRGRLIAINNISVNQIFGEQVKQINPLRRELNLSWTDNLPAENKIIAGTWTPAEKAGNWVSVEQGVADTLGIRLGDSLNFRIAETIISVNVSSIRKVNWASFKPNFFMLFKPGILEDMPQTSITSLYLDSTQQNKLTVLVKKFPNLTVIDVAETIKKVRSILDNTTKAINFLTFFGFLAGLIIVILAMLSFSSIKQQETSILKTLGMRRKQLLWIQSSESILIGFYAGLLAIFMAIVINKYLAYRLLDMSFSSPWHLVIIVPVITALITVIINSLVLMTQYQKQGLRTIS